MTPESVLQSAQADQITKANAWEVFHGATDQKDFESRLGSLNLPQDIKANLWEIKYGAQADPLKTGVGMEERAQQQAVTERRQQALGTPPDYAHKWMDLGHPGTVQPSAIPQLVRGATGSLPGLGMTAGGMLASPGAVTTPVGVGLGGAAGEQARLLANRSIFGPEEPATTSREGLKSTAEVGLTGALTEGAMQGMGAATRGFAARPRPIEALKGGPVEAGTEDIFMATQPGAGAKDLALRDNIETAKGDLAEIQRKNPTALSEKAGGVVNPDMRVRSFVKNTNDYLGGLWKNEVMPMTRRWSSAQVSLQPMKQSMLDAVSGIQTEFSPAAARQVQAWVNRMPETETLGDLMNRRAQVNSMLKSFEGKSVQDQAAILRQKPMVDALKAQDKAIDSAVMQELQNRGEPGIQELSKRYAALSDIRDSMQNQMNSAESYRMYRQIGVYMNPRSWFSAHERVPMGATRPGPLLEKGLERLERGGVTAPSPAATPPAKYTPLLPAIGETGQGGIDPALGAQAPGGPNTALPPRPMPESAPGTFAIQRVPNLGKQAPGGPNTALPPRIGYPAATPEAAGEALARVPGRTYREAGAAGIRTPPPGYSSPGVTEGTGIERDLASQLKRGDISQSDVMQMAKDGKIAYDAPRRIFRAAQRGVKAPPPETATQFRNRKNQ